MHNCFKSSFYKHKCPVEGCSSSFSGRGILGLHLRIHNNVKIPCSLCPYRSVPSTFRSSFLFQIRNLYKSATIDKQYRAHMNNHFKINPIECDLCDKRFGTKSQLNYHVQRDHDGIRITCPICKNTFSNG